jgi:hypothetical protein
VSDSLFTVAPSPTVIAGRLPIPPGEGLRLAPCTIKVANAVVASWHRHSTPISQKVIAAVRAMHGDETIGVAILGYPVSRVLDDGLNVEIRRVCVRDEAPRNACSMLYGALCRAAGALGFVAAYTYTTEDEDAASVKAAGFIRDGQRAAANWDPSRRRDAEHHDEADRVRWIRVLR